MYTLAIKKSPNFHFNQISLCLIFLFDGLTSLTLKCNRIYMYERVCMLDFANDNKSNLLFWLWIQHNICFNWVDNLSYSTKTIEMGILNSFDFTSNWFNLWLSWFVDYSDRNPAWLLSLVDLSVDSFSTSVSSLKRW